MISDLRAVAAWAWPALLMGTSGAMQWFAPVQPVLAVAAVGLLAWALRARLRGEKACRVPTSV